MATSLQHSYLCLIASKLGNSFNFIYCSIFILTIPYSHNSNILNEHGFTPLQFSPNDINMNEKSISVFVVDVWAESILPGISEIFERLYNQQSLLQDVNMNSRKSEASYAALQTRVSDLQSKLYQVEKREEKALRRVKELEDEQYSRLKKGKVEDNEIKKLTKNLELQIQESERRVRQRDIEINRLKEKLRTVVNKDKETTVKHRATINALKQGLISPSKLLNTSTNSVFSMGSLASPSPSPDRKSRHNISTTSAATGTYSVTDIIEALEHQRDFFVKRNAELDEQVVELSIALREYSNGNTNIQLPLTGKSTNTENTKENIKVSDMNTLVDEQRLRIDSLTHRGEIYKKQLSESENTIQEMRSRTVSLQETIDNLRIELESRPTQRMLKQKQKEIDELENRIHDIIMKRGETAEISAWKKHLETSERIKVDKRNHELGLWLLENLPRTVMKETLQGVCRELDLSEVSEIIPTILKLKAVVQAVPRMEKFISSTCQFIFERDHPEMSGVDKKEKARPIMEQVLPVLSRWWDRLQLCEELIEFSNFVLLEIRRRDALLTNGTEASGSSTIRDQVTSLKGKTHKDAIFKLREMIELEAKVLKHNTSFKAAEDFIRDQPDVFCNRILSHLLYLFQVPTLDGLLPKCNQIYIKTEEINTFLKEMRGTLGIKEKDDTKVLSELRRVTTRLLMDSEPVK